MHESIVKKIVGRGQQFLIYFDAERYVFTEYLQKYYSWA